MVQLQYAQAQVQIFVVCVLTVLSSCVRYFATSNAVMTWVVISALKKLAHVMHLATSLERNAWKPGLRACSAGTKLGTNIGYTSTYNQLWWSSKLGICWIALHGSRTGPYCILRPSRDLTMMTEYGSQVRLLPAFGFEAIATIQPQVSSSDRRTWLRFVIK